MLPTHYEYHTVDGRERGGKSLDGQGSRRHKGSGVEVETCIHDQFNHAWLSLFEMGGHLIVCISQYK